MRVPPAVMQRRDEEFAAATTAHEVNALQERWLAEDQALALAADFRTKRADEQERRLRDLERRLKALERAWNRLPTDLGKIIGEERRTTAARLAKALQEHAGMSYCGVHDPARGYVTGSVVTAKSGLWIATDVAPAGDKPGRSPSWRLIVKGRVEEPALA